MDLLGPRCHQCIHQTWDSRWLWLLRHLESRSIGESRLRFSVSSVLFNTPRICSRQLQVTDEHAGVEDAIKVRDVAVSNGLKKYAPDICEELASMNEVLWDAAKSLPISGRVLYAAQLGHRRLDDPLIDAWLAVNCIREWRGDTHWAMLIAEGITGVQAGILDGARRSYEEDWLPRSRGADDETISTAYADLEKRGLAREQTVNQSGIAYRQSLEDKLDDTSSLAWRHLGETFSKNFIGLINKVGDTLLGRIDETGGTKWMPAARRLNDSPES